MIEKIAVTLRKTLIYISDAKYRKYFSDTLERRQSRYVRNTILRRRSQLTAFLPLILLIQGYGNNYAGGKHKRHDSSSSLM